MKSRMKKFLVLGILFLAFFPSSVGAQTLLPDLTSSLLSACYRPKNGNPSIVELVVTSKEKNIGTNFAPSHWSRLWVDGYGLGCQKPGIPPVATHLIPTLYPGQQYTLASFSVLGTFNPWCGMNGKLFVSYQANVYCDVCGKTGLVPIQESNYANNANRIYPVLPCALKPTPGLPSTSW